MDVKSRTTASISQEIQMREATKNKFAMIEGPIRRALREVVKRGWFEQKRIDELMVELKARRQDE